MDCIAFQQPFGGLAGPFDFDDLHITPDLIGLITAERQLTATLGVMQIRHCPSVFAFFALQPGWPKQAYKTARGYPGMKHISTNPVALDASNFPKKRW